MAPFFVFILENLLWRKEFGSPAARNPKSLEDELGVGRGKAKRHPVKKFKKGLYGPFFCLYSGEFIMAKRIWFARSA
ncbi:hypothetical protein, partial [Salmonella enterica]|uniref:hypothetical protein n=1 Tax=Salmonella enterica TaxID=28901 RepID=UPI002E987F62|nr:hypothetical protein [Salmonella enterica subsp. enterica serovar Paratyphi A]